MSLTETFVAFSLETEYESLPGSVRRAASRCVVDHLGCVVGGMQTELGRIVSGLVRDEGGAGQATLVASNGERVPATAAALANGTAANALDYDDTLAGHPGSTVIAAALAAAELAGSDGRCLLTAVVAGYDVCSRIALFWHPMGGRYKRVWDTATLQTFGAVAAAGRLLGLSASQMHDAFGIAAATAPIPRVRPSTAHGEAIRPMLKSAWGWAAQAGVRAVLLARAGMTGQRQPLDGDTLVWELQQPHRSSLLHPDDRLGEVFLIEQVEFKPYPACRFLHPVLDALSELITTHRVSWHTVEEVRVAGFDLLGDAYHYIPEPTSHSEAQFSTPFCAAALLYHGHPRPTAFSSTGLSNPDVLALAQRVKVTVDPEFQKVFPAKHGARVTLVTSRGDVWETVCDEPRGTPSHPLDDAELTSKFIDLTEPLFAPEEALRLVERVLNLESESYVRDMMTRFG